ncbi:S8 family peptidase [Halobacillus sp. Marseille-Q1614]|uniref:S8 family peptidase n=1 Tax=Halobacillus sp. Marseille-Q1614 TaxID=2709134 RepID=UPI00156EFC4E|nr:S8 family peptidase [Halobacillus sp. Marseille-Q1614]
MFGYSMIKMVRSHAVKIDHPLRNLLVGSYKPFKWVPCFMHNMLEGWIKSRKKIEVVIEFDKNSPSFMDAAQEVVTVSASHKKCRVHKMFAPVSCISAHVTPKGLEDILNNCSCVKRVYLNRDVHAFLDVAIPSARAANIVQNKTNLTGRGVNIAVIDTGIYPHQDLEERIIDFADFVNDRTDPYDDNGHGTHCAGDAASSGFASDGKYRGPAPEANLIGVKVLNKMGAGSLVSMMEGLDWCIQYNEDPNNTSKIDIISMSLGTTAGSYTSENDDPMVQYVELAWESGIVVVVAAGNEGPDAQTIASPGISDRVITVGALDDRNTPDTRDDDDVAGFSSRGPTLYGVAKPDILAPGVNIISLRSPNSYLDKLQKSSRVDTHYLTLSGTSMATPIIAGIVALMLEANPELTPDEVKQALINGADLWQDRENNIYGAGYVNAERSIGLISK